MIYTYVFIDGDFMPIYVFAAVAHTAWVWWIFRRKVYVLIHMQ